MLAELFVSGGPAKKRKRWQIAGGWPPASDWPSTCSWPSAPRRTAWARSATIWGHGLCDLSNLADPAWSRDETADPVRLLPRCRRRRQRWSASEERASGGIVTASAEIADASADLSARTEQPAASPEQSASAMRGRIGATIRHLGQQDRAGHAGWPRKTASLAQQGEQAFGRAVQSMDGIRQSSSRISDIIGVIDGIAFQTNILALNVFGGSRASRRTGPWLLPWVARKSGCAGRPPRPKPPGKETRTLRASNRSSKAQTGFRPPNRPWTS